MKVPLGKPADAPPPYTLSAQEPMDPAGNILRGSLNEASSNDLPSHISPETRTRNHNHPVILTPAASSGESNGASTTTRTRERLRQAEKERDELRNAMARLGGGNDHEWSQLTAASKKPKPNPRARIDELKREANGEAAATPARSTEGMFKTAYATDLLFLIDTTGSMKNHLAAAKDQVRSIMDDIKRAFLEEAEVRVSVVAYRDHGDNPRIQFVDFTTSSDKVYKFLATLKAGGAGGDPPEDVLGGIDRALQASWKNQTRCIIHIGDQAPHGKIFNDRYNKHDRYPEPGSEPHGLTYQPLLKKMIEMGVNYALLKIGGATDQMAYLFMKEYANAGAECQLHSSNWYYSLAEGEKKTYKKSQSWASAKGGLTFQEAQIGTTYNDLRRLVVDSVTSSASRTAVRLSQSSSLKGGQDAGKKDVKALASIEEDEVASEKGLEEVPPNWDTPGWLNQTMEVEGFCPDVAHGVSTLNNMMDSDDNIRLRLMDLTIKKRSKPFSQGAMRLASYARTESSSSNFVVKSFKRDGRFLAHLAEDMRIQTLCKGFALEFNALVGDKHALDFLVTACLKGKSRTTSVEYTSLEPYIEGSYVKYNNNSGYVNKENPEDEVNKAAQAFSHFTFERSCGHLLVCDLQGVGQVLTDPAIHTLDAERFRRSDANLHQEGFKFFFSTHQCNDICRKLELKSTAAMIAANKLEFRERWPSMDNTVCCSNKLCGKIVRTSSANKSDDFPGCHWCDGCWPQLTKFSTIRVCIASGPHHEFEASRFFYESQGRSLPRNCPQHREEENEARMAAVGGSFWNRLKSATKQQSVSGKSW